MTSTTLYYIYLTVGAAAKNDCQINVVDNEIWQRSFGAYFSTCFILHKWKWPSNLFQGWRKVKSGTSLAVKHTSITSHLQAIGTRPFSKMSDLSAFAHRTHPLNETKRFVMRPAFRMYGSCLISPDSDWGMQTEYPEGCRVHVRSDILQSDVSGSMLWACSITWCLSVIPPSLLQRRLHSLLSSAGEQWAAPAAQYDESYLCKHPGCLSHG